MAPHSSTLAWKIPWMEEPGGLQSMGSLRVGHDWVTSLSLFTFMHWRRKWQPTPVLLPGDPRDGEAWWAAIYGVAQSRTRLKWLSSSSSSVLWIELSPHQNSHIEALTSNVTILGDRASKEVRPQRDLIDWCPFRKRKKPQNSLTGTDSVCRCHRERAMWQHGEKATTCQARREVSAETKAAGTWSWASNLQNGEEISCFCCLSDPVCGIWLWYGSPSWLVQSHSISKLAMTCHQV